MPAEQPAIRRSPTTGGKHVVFGRKRPSPPCFPPADALGARRFRLSSVDEGRVRISVVELRKEARLALGERRPEDRVTSTITCDRRLCPVLRLPAVVRRPGPRRCRILVACSLRLESICVHLCDLWALSSWVGWLCAFATWRLCVKDRDLLGAWCLCGSSGGYAGISARPAAARPPSSSHPRCVVRR